MASSSPPPPPHLEVVVKKEYDVDVEAIEIIDGLQFQNGDLEIENESLRMEIDDLVRINDFHKQHMMAMQVDLQRASKTLQDTNKALQDTDKALRDMMDYCSSLETKVAGLETDLKSSFKVGEEVIDISKLICKVRDDARDVRDVCVELVDCDMQTDAPIEILPNPPHRKTQINDCATQTLVKLTKDCATHFSPSTKEFSTNTTLVGGNYGKTSVGTCTPARPKMVSTSMETVSLIPKKTKDKGCDPAFVARAHSIAVGTTGDNDKFSVLVAPPPPPREVVVEGASLSRGLLEMVEVFKEDGNKEIPDTPPKNNEMKSTVLSATTTTNVNSGGHYQKYANCASNSIVVDPMINDGLTTNTIMDQVKHKPFTNLDDLIAHLHRVFKFTSISTSASTSEASEASETSEASGETSKANMETQILGLAQQIMAQQPAVALLTSKLIELSVSASNLFVENRYFCDHGLLYRPGIFLPGEGFDHTMFIDRHRNKHPIQEIMIRLLEEVPVLVNLKLIGVSWATALRYWTTHYLELALTFKMIILRTFFWIKQQSEIDAKKEGHTPTTAIRMMIWWKCVQDGIEIPEGTIYHIITDPIYGRWLEFILEMLSPGTIDVSSDTNGGVNEKHWTQEVSIVDSILDAVQLIHDGFFYEAMAFMTGKIFFKDFPDELAHEVSDLSKQMKLDEFPQRQHLHFLFMLWHHQCLRLINMLEWIKQNCNTCMEALLILERGQLFTFTPTTTLTALAEKKGRSAARLISEQFYGDDDTQHPMVDYPPVPLQSLSLDVKLRLGFLFSKDELMPFVAKPTANLFEYVTQFEESLQIKTKIPANFTRRDPSIFRHGENPESYFYLKLGGKSI